MCVKTIQSTRTDKKEIAYYTNVFASKVNRFVGYIYKKLPIRNTNNKIIIQILNDVNMRGDNINVFMQNFATLAKVTGVGVVLIDMPSSLSNNLQDQLQNRELPYLVDINPSNITEYTVDNFGKFESVSFTDYMLIDGEREQITRTYDKTSWSVKKEDTLINGGEHNLGVCPVLFLSERGKFNSIGEFSSVAKLQKRHYNLQSELDEILRYQTFPVLTMQGDLDDNDIKVSNDSIILYDREVNSPNFIAPPSAPAELYQSRIKEIEYQISSVCYDTTTNQLQESGIALDIKFQGLNSALSTYSTQLEDFENRVFDVICRYLQLNNDISISYPKTFSIIDINQEVQIFSQMKELVNSPKYFELKAINIINNDLTNISIEDFEVIKQEIEDSMK